LYLDKIKFFLCDGWHVLGPDWQDCKLWPCQSRSVAVTGGLETLILSGLMLLFSLLQMKMKKSSIPLGVCLLGAAIFLPSWYEPDIWNCYPAPVKCLYRAALVMVSVRWHKTLLTGKSVLEVGYCCFRPEHAFVWMNMDLGAFILKAVECFKWGSMGHPSRNMEEFCTESDVICWDLGHEVSMKYFNMCLRYCLCTVLV